MANKKTAPVEAIEAAASAIAEEVKAEQPAAPAEEKKPAAKRGRKPAAEKKEKAPAAKKTAAADKPAKAAKATKAAKAAKADKPAAEAPKKRASRKSAAKKTVSYEEIVEMAKKKFLAADKTRIKYPIAVNVNLTGACEGIFYICIDSESISVEPYKYNDYDVELEADAEEFVKVLSGKLNIYDALSNDVKISGIAKKAVLFLNAAF